MRVVILIKQVPETSAVRLDEETGTMVREGVEAIVNPLDLYAVECALRLRDDLPGPHETVVLSMGPPKAEAALREVLAMGVDRGVLLSDRAFAGSDTWATSHTLAAAIRRLGRVDLVLCGERATDGDTGQVGPGVAAFLDLPLVTYAARVDIREDNRLQADRLIEGGRETVEAPLPAVVTVLKAVGDPRLPTLHGKRRARAAEVPVWDHAELGLAAAALGLKGSPTRVERIFRPRLARDCLKLPAGAPHAVVRAADRLAAFLQQRSVL
ncbi:MAG: electron transfer flavoprotein subunit beta/FixA family protein [Lentisphaeria bacterium]|nr:electron transfer flavoprotein subunit beta/FixA family protein [Lentisphaeria bacterium]